MKNARKIETEQRREASVVNALNYVWHHPEKTLNLEALSKECGVSKFHFHRLFREYQGETLNEHVTRKRLEFAANHLIMLPHMNVAQLANNLGFSSAANFSKAFKRYFGVTPREWRNPDRIRCVSEGIINSKHGKVINPKLHYSHYQFGDNQTRQKRLSTLDELISFVRLEQQTLMYQTVVNGMDLSVSLSMWNKVMEWAASHVDDWQTKLFSLWYDNSYVCPQKFMRHDAAILVPNTFEVPRTFMSQTLDAGIYATGVLQGSHEELCATGLDIYMLWFAHKRLIPDLRPYYVNYLNNIEEDEFYKIRFYIKIHPNISERKLNVKCAHNLCC